MCVYSGTCTGVSAPSCVHSTVGAAGMWDDAGATGGGSNGVRW